MKRHRWFSLSSSLVPFSLIACTQVVLAACSDESEGPADLASDSAETTPRQLTAIGVQLYTLRAAMEADFEGTLRNIADMGYQEVEFAGLFGRDPAQVRQLLTDLNLTAVGSHVDWSRFRSDPNAAIEETVALGAQYLVFAWMPEAERLTLAQWQNWVTLFNEVGQASSDRGIEFAYHNHDFEFTAVEGVRPYDVLLEGIDRNVVKLELDLYWLAKAGSEPDPLFDLYPGGFPLAHVKDMRRSDQAMVDVGQGDLDFAAVFAQAERSGMQHFIVEHDEPANPMQTVENSLTYLKQLSF
jgi:sugar phosphate isomerase/epimerase